MIPVSDMDVWRELGLVYRRDRTLPRSASAFVNMIRQGINHHPDAHSLQEK